MACFLLEYVRKACTVLYYDKFEVDLVHVLSCFFCPKEWVNFGDEKDICSALYCSAWR